MAVSHFFRTLMSAAVLAALFFALSAIFSQRAGRIFGSLAANFYRLCGACAILGLIVVAAFPGSVHPQLFWWFILSGAVGFGLGDICLFLAYPRLGSRITLLIQFCVSTLTGALGDYFWLGTRLGGWEILAIIAVLGGLAITVFAGGNVSLERRGSITTGVLLALGSAISMGMGTTISHVAIEKAKLLALEVPSMSQAWQRSIAGVVVAGLAFAAQGLAMRMLKTEPVQNLAPSKAPLKPRSGCVSSFWLVGTMLMGPVIGISLYQKALGVTQSSAIVLAVAATSALIIIPLARWLEKDKPGIRELIGTVVAITSVAWLCWLRS